MVMKDVLLKLLREMTDEVAETEEAETGETEETEAVTETEIEEEDHNQKTDAIFAARQVTGRETVHISICTDVMETDGERKEVDLETETELETSIEEKEDASSVEKKDIKLLIAHIVMTLDSNEGTIEETIEDEEDDQDLDQAATMPMQGTDLEEIVEKGEAVLVIEDHRGDTVEIEIEVALEIDEEVEE